MHNQSKFAFLIAIILIVLNLGCRKAANTTPSTTQPANAASPQTALNHPEGGVTQPPATKYFKGSIGNSLDLQMKLVRTGDQLTGSYYYQKIGKRIDLRGTVDKDGQVVLEEFDAGGKQSGVFKGIWNLKPQDGMVSIAGNWSKPPGSKDEDKKTAFSIHEEPISFSGETDLITKQIKESNQKLVYEINAQYPQITGGNNPNFEKFNQAVRGSIMKEVGVFKKEMVPDSDEESRPESSMRSSLDIGYQIALAQDDLVSVSFDVGSYYQGAAHPNTSSQAINYDLKNGRLLKLADLFKPNTKYLQSLSTYCIGDLKKQSKEKGGTLEDRTINEGAAPTARNYQSWNIKKQGLLINFDAYQVGPYAAGPQFVVVPYSNLKDLINPDGPIGQFAK
jgi:Protein of unknown function (DUF3298)/Deacetylase PdaC